MKIETLRGVLFLNKIRELESKNIPVRSVTVGRTNAEWIVEHDNPPEENLKLNLTTVNQNSKTDKSHRPVSGARIEI